MRTYQTVILPFAAWLCASCAALPAERPEFDVAEARLTGADEQAALPSSATPDDYVDFAIQRRSELQASLERWRAASARVEAINPLPPLEVMYGYYFLRGGTERHHVTVRQGIPWPSKARRLGDARRIAAAVDGVQHDAELLAVRWEVTDAYWQLWAIEERHHWLVQHQQIAALLADTVRGRVEVGMASLADVSQAELLVARTADDIDRAAAQKRRAVLDLIRVTGASFDDVDLAGRGTPRGPREPVEDDADIVAAAMQNPQVRVWAARRAGAAAESDSARAALYPDFGVGVEWMEMAPGHDPSAPDAGKDSIIGTVALRIPLWSAEVRGTQRSLAARSASFEASEDAARRDVETAVRKVLSELRETAYRVRLYERTLVPQAEDALGSVGGAYETGQGGLAGMLLAQRELLQLQLQLAAMLAEHERQWAMLERLVARPVPAQEVP